MARFMLAYLQEGELDGERILREDTVDKMFHEQFTHHPRLDGMAQGFIKATYNGRDTFQHPGGTMLYDTGFYLLPEEEAGFFISHSGGNYLVNIEIFQGFMDRYFPGEGIAAPPPSQDMAERSKEYTGEYPQNRRSFTTPDKLLSLLIGVIQVNVDEEGFLLVTHLGETNRFVEVEPGVYHNLREGRTQDYGGDFRTIVFSTDPLGKTMLMTDGPMSYSRAFWYETFGITFLKIILSTLIIIGSFLYWGVKAIPLKRGRKRGQLEEKGKGPIWARRIAVVQGFFTFAFATEFIIESVPDPVYGLPPSAYTQPSVWTRALDLVVPYGMVLLGLAVVVFAVLAWHNSYWKLAGRIHYTFFALASIVLIWIFYFWKVI